MKEMISLKSNKIFFCYAFLFLTLPAMFIACNKTKIEPVEVYPEAPEVLVKFLDNPPNPSIGAEGSEVVFSVTGLKDKEGKFEFFINQIEAEVLSVTDETVTVKVPSSASTGGSSILIDGEYYFGPTFKVRGKVSIDPTFNPDLYKSNGPILEMREWNSSIYVAAGSFTDYQDKASKTIIIPGIVKLDKATLGYNSPGATESQLKVGEKGFTGTVSSVIPVDNGKYVIAGSFSQYDTITNINSITRIYQNGAVDSMVVDVVGTAPLDKATVPAFNGGVTGSVVKTFYDEAEKTFTLFGNFNAYVNTFYERSSIDGLLFDFIEMSQLVRLKENGEFDSTFNYNHGEKKGYSGGNGFVYDAVKLSNGDFLVTGNFTTYHKVAAKYIVRINGSDGSVSNAFSGGADGPINRIVQNKKTGNILITGNFKHYNGQPVNGVVMIKETGEINTTFNFREIDGVPNFAGQLDNGKVIVSGSFTRYNDVVREGMAILNEDGTLAKGYNNFGLFRGQINNFIETTTNAGQPAVILYGAFDKFDNRTVGNIVKFRMED